MAESVNEHHLNIFKSLFRGRDDVFAVRWEKDGKSGYMPAYDVDWEAYKVHKAKGGSFQTFALKTYKKLKEKEILKHLAGEQLIGVYPLLPDNTSWFIAADFDEENWAEDSVRFVNVCAEMNLPAYLERSRSGNGAHVWLFFDQPYPAIKCRKIVSTLLIKAGIISPSDKTSSFDRLFPNQDFLSGKGLGNLIALPLHKKSYEEGNSCFIDVITKQPIEPQWDFLKTIQKISAAYLDKLYQEIVEKESFVEAKLSESHSSLQIILDNKLHISRNKCPLPLYNFIKGHLNFLNSGYIIRKKAGQGTWNTESYFKALDETVNEITVPKGFTGKVLRFCKEEKIEFNFLDKRRKLTPVKFTSTIQLKDLQDRIIQIARKRDLGIISSPPGSGKTVIGLAIIAEKQQPALIIVHRQQLAEQWKERVQSFLKTPKHEIGFIGKGEIKIGSKITIAMIQSLSELSKKKELDKLKCSFGTILIDECHHVPAEIYRDCIEQFDSYYLYGLTATPFRKGNDEKLLFAYLGDIIAEISPQELSQAKISTLIVRDTELNIPFNSHLDKPETLFRILAHDSTRNRLIIADVEREAKAGRKIIIITERKEHIEVLHQDLKQSLELVTLSGDDKGLERNRKNKLLENKDFDVLITTGQFFGEGSDFSSIDCLFLVYPFSFEGKFIQYIGRVQRGEFTPVIYDYRDKNIEYLEKMFQKRSTYYRELNREELLSTNNELILEFENNTVKILGLNKPIELSKLELPDSIDGIRSNIFWLVRVLKYDEEGGSLFCEILSYDYKIQDAAQIKQLYTPINTIKFRSLDTGELLACSFIKNHHIPIALSTASLNYSIQTAGPTEWIEETIKVPISTLQFDYGIIRFTYFLQRIYQQVVFEIVNQNIRPEFEVLKSYFSKALKAKKISVGIRVSIKDGGMVSAEATSFDLEKINEEVIEGVKFNFIMRDVLKRKPDKASPLSLNECLGQDKTAPLLYSSEQDFLDDMLKWKTVKHFHQLKYLAQRHSASIMKIRFVLMPFSFVFLITGEERFHMIFETLDTEEATYIWHFDRDADNFNEKIQEIDAAIAELRSNGRQAYLDSAPKDFTRILHDYSGANRGFILWKSQFDEKIN